MLKTISKNIFFIHFIINHKSIIKNEYEVFKKKILMILKL